MEEARKKIRTCLEDQEAFCTAACPFDFDVRNFIDKIQRGRFNAGFRAYQNSVAFPGIVSYLCHEPCKDVCIRGKKDGAISIRLLEKASIDYAARINPNNYNLPLKNKKIAVIGGGISGLACALRLCAKKYEVTIYEKSHRIGGSLWDIMPSDIFLNDIKQQFMYEEYKLCLNTEIINLGELEFDAIYVATGTNGRDFGLKGNKAGKRPGVFLGGSLMGKNIIEAIADGLNISKSIEGYIKTGSMNTPKKNNETRLQLDIKELPYAKPLIPSNGSAFTRDEALQEAKRCLKCKCDNCIQYCDLMRSFNKYPKIIENEVEATINPGTLDGNGTIATRFISTCNQCGLCKEVCPQDIDMGDFLLKSHRIMQQKGGMPWVFHDFWLRDMEFTNSKYAQVSRLPMGYEKSSYMFFPGCQLGASDSKYVIESYNFLLKEKPDTALILGCCGAPAEWAGDKDLHNKVIEKLRNYWTSFGKPKAIFACPTCKQMFNRYLPEIEGVFLYDLMLKSKVPISVDGSGEIVSVFDPCSSREEPHLQKVIRQLTQKSGFRLNPLPMEGKLANCCSWGGQVSIANPYYTRQVVKKRIRQNDNPYITYCINCRDIFAAAKKPVYHILDILFGLHDSGRIPPTVTKRRNNRVILKQQVLSRFWKEDFKMEEREMKFNLNIIPQLGEKLDSELILETDIEAVIEHCESSGKKVLNPNTGNFFGHLQIGNMTYWVEYKSVDNGFNLVNAYSHRMSIDEGERDGGR